MITIVLDTRQANFAPYMQILLVKPTVPRWLVNIGIVMDMEGVCFIEDAWTVQVRVDDGLYT